MTSSLVSGSAAPLVADVHSGTFAEIASQTRFRQPKWGRGNPSMGRVGCTVAHRADLTAKAIACSLGNLSHRHIGVTVLPGTVMPRTSLPRLRHTGWGHLGLAQRRRFTVRAQGNLSKTVETNTGAASHSSSGSNSRSGSSATTSSASRNKQKQQSRDLWKKEPSTNALDTTSEPQNGIPVDQKPNKDGSKARPVSNDTAQAGVTASPQKGDSATSKTGNKQKTSKKGSTESGTRGLGEHSEVLETDAEETRARAADDLATAGRPAGKVDGGNWAATLQASDGASNLGELTAEDAENGGFTAAASTEKSLQPGEGHDSSLSDEEEGQLTETDDSGFDSEGEDVLTAHSGIEEEALDLLEWGEVCVQVSRFCDTPMAYQRALEEKLDMGRSVEESDMLLTETAAALNLPRRLVFDGAADITPMLRRAAADVSRVRSGEGEEAKACSLADLCTVLSFLESADSLHGQLNALAAEATSSASLAPLQDALAGASWEQCRSIKTEIARCLNPALRALKDEASDELAQIRKQKRENMAALLALLQAETKRLVSESQGGAGAWDGQQGAPTRRRSRLCIPIRANMKSLLPGCVSLDTSNTGATLFVEPAGAIPLNNREAELQGRERAEERRVLMGVAALLAASAAELQDLQARIIRLDFACARARHALWLSGARPTLIDPSGICWQGEGHDGLANAGTSPSEGKEEKYFVSLSGIRHPILLGRALDAGSNFPAASSASLAQHQDESDAGDALLEEGNGASAEGPRLPVPIDIKVREGTRAVVVSGPNAGGKTLMLKTLGLAALMAKGGLFLPTAGTAAGCPVVLPWFDKVLVDIGDEQSLEQSLSTFSGHIRRICRILEAVTRGSLVLLDEVGSGTDPSEGAALASSLLASLADPSRDSAACLTMTTTHYAQLKTLKTKLRGFEDASVEFDPVTLKPTFQVLWGEAGESNALSIAATKGMPESVIARARELVGGTEPTLSLGSGMGELLSTNIAGSEPESREEEWSSGPLLESLKLQMDHQEQNASEAAVGRAKALELHSEVKESYEAVYLQETTLRRKDDERTKVEAKNAKTRIQTALDEFEATLGSLREGKGGERVSVEEIEELEQVTHSIITEHAQPFVALLKTDQEKEQSQSASPDGSAVEKWAPQVGDQVLVKSIGGSAGIIESIKGATCQVKMGRLSMSVRLKDLLQKPK